MPLCTTLYTHMFVPPPPPHTHKTPTTLTQHTTAELLVIPDTGQNKPNTQSHTQHSPTQHHTHNPHTQNNNNNSWKLPTEPRCACVLFTCAAAATTTGTGGHEDTKHSAGVHASTHTQTHTNTHTSTTTSMGGQHVAHNSKNNAVHTPGAMHGLTGQRSTVNASPPMAAVAVGCVDGSVYVLYAGLPQPVMMFHHVHPIR